MPSQLLKLYGGGFAPSSISGLIGWYSSRFHSSMLVERTSATTVATSNGDAIGTWNDLSGNGRTLTASTDAKRPTLETNAINGLPGVKFDGVDDGLLTSANIGISGTAARTMFTVAKEYNSSTKYPAIASWGGSSTNTAYYHQIFNGTIGVAIWTNSSTTAISAGTYTVISSHLNSSNQPVGYRNGSTIGTIPHAANTTDTPFKVGYLDSAAPQYLASTIVEVILFNRNLSTAERKYIERGLGMIYGITIS